MATLLPSLSSDDEDDVNIKGKTQNDESASESESEDETLDKDFTFGGGIFDGYDDSFALGRSKKTEWSYKSALDLLAKNDTQIEVERTEVSNIIAAARANMLKQQKKEKEVVDVVNEQESESESEDEMEEKEDGDDASDSEEEESEEEQDAASNSDENSDSDEDESDSDEEEQVDDAPHIQEQDVLKTKINAVTKAKKSRDEESDQDEKSPASDKEADRSDDEDEDDEQDEETRKEAAKAASFFDTAEEESDDITQFSQLALSRPLLRAVASMGYVTPTPIQRQCIPLALAGRDVCASAVTGSGKTAAFLLPILEKTLQRKHYTYGSTTRALILCPTRELAAQCLAMMIAMTSHITPEGYISGCLIVGGAKNTQAQATQLKARPDVVVATPGRLVDHILNTPSFDLTSLDFLVLDEADRLLELGFQDEVHEIVKHCPTQRQTMLFSATMDTKVDELIKLSLKRPIRVAVSDKKKGRGTASSAQGSDANSSSSATGGVEVAPRLDQEFVRIRPGNEGNREAIMLSLLTRTYKNRVICFFDTKATAHRFRILAGLVGIPCTELHGDLTQPQRLEALEAFRKGDVDVLLATDLAGRGIDIPDVDAVLNFDMPSQIANYVHRIGRTARAGRGGKACTLIGEGRRHLMKEVIKDAEQKNKSSRGDKGSPVALIRSRTVPPAVVAHYAAKISSLESHIDEVLMAEKVAKLDRVAEVEAIRAQNIIKHSDEIMSRPAREWFVGANQKEAAAEAKKQKEEKLIKAAGTGTHGMSRKKRRAREAREELLKAQAEVRAASEQTGKTQKKVMTDKSIKLSAKAQKKAMKEKDGVSTKRSIHDEDAHREDKRQKKNGMFGKEALGDSGLFDEEKVAFSKKEETSTSKPSPSAYHFRGYDPDKKFGKGGKRGHASFKSKAKYKRRK